MRDILGRGNSVCKRQEARGMKEHHGWLLWLLGHRSDRRWAGPTVDFDAAGNRWICTRRGLDIHGSLRKAELWWVDSDVPALN